MPAGRQLSTTFFSPALRERINLFTHWGSELVNMRIAYLTTGKVSLNRGETNLGPMQYSLETLISFQTSPYFPFPLSKYLDNLLNLVRGSYLKLRPDFLLGR